MITKEELIKVAKLSKFSFTEEEFNKIKGNLDNIVKLLDKLNEVDLTGIEPLYSPLEESIFQREDIVKNCENRDRLMNASSYSENNVISIPKVID